MCRRDDIIRLDLVSLLLALKRPKKVHMVKDLESRTSVDNASVGTPQKWGLEN